jgi:hypothetical protein
MSKNPKMRGAPKPLKHPTSRAAARQVSEPPMSWRFEHVDLAGTWGWTTLEHGDIETLRRELVELEKATRRKLQVDQKLNPIPCHDLCPAAQDRLRELELDQWEELWQLVLRSGHRDRWRAWGLAEGHYFYLLWWDPKHTVCPRGPRKGVAKHR